MIQGQKTQNGAPWRKSNNKTCFQRKERKKLTQQLVPRKAGYSQRVHCITFSKSNTHSLLAQRTSVHITERSPPPSSPTYPFKYTTHQQYWPRSTATLTCTGSHKYYHQQSGPKSSSEINKNNDQKENVKSASCASNQLLLFIPCVRTVCRCAGSDHWREEKKRSIPNKLKKNNEKNKLCAT